MKMHTGLRVLSATLSVMMLLEPIVYAQSALTKAGGASGQDPRVTEMAGRLKAAKAFEASPDAENLYQRWGSVLTAFDLLLPMLGDQGRGERAVCQELLAHLDKGGKAMAGKAAGTDAAKLAETDGTIRKNLSAVAVRRGGIAASLLADVEQAGRLLGDLKGAAKLDWHLLGSLAKVESGIRRLQDVHDLGQSYWGLLRVTQPELLALLKVAEAEALGQDMQKVDRALAAASTAFAASVEGVDRLGQISLAPLKPVNVEKQNQGYLAALSLVESLQDQMRVLTDANAQAHRAALQRVERHLLESIEAWNEASGAGVDVATGSFLSVPRAGSVSGPWAEKAEQLRAVCTGLVSGLQSKDEQVQALLRGIPKALEQARKALGSVDLAASGMAKEDLAVLPELAADADAHAAYIGQLASRREAVMQELAKTGKKPFAEVDLSARREAAAYDRVGLIAEEVMNEARDVDRLVCLIMSLLQVAKVGQGPELGRELGVVREPLQVALDKLESLAAADGKLLAQMQEQGRDVLKAGAAQLEAFSAVFEKSLVLVGEAGEYAKVLKAMGTKLAGDAGFQAALSAGLEKAPTGKGVGELSLSWSGASGLGRAFSRSIERAGYLATRGLEDLKTLVAGQASEVVRKQSLLDLALALDFPVVMSVPASGIRLVMGQGSETVTWEGIGNVDGVRLAAGGLPMDFTLTGVQVGGIWDTAYNAASGVAGFAWDTGAKMIENIRKDPWKIAEYSIYGLAGLVTLAAAVVTVPAWGTALAGGALTVAGAALLGDAIGAAIDVLVDKKWIPPLIGDILKVGYAIYDLVKDGGIKKGLKAIWTDLRHAPQRLRSLGRGLWQIFRGMNPSNLGQRMTQVIKIVQRLTGLKGNLNDVTSLIDNLIKWIGNPFTKPGTFGGPGRTGQPGTGLPPPGDDDGGGAPKGPVKLDALR